MSGLEAVAHALAGSTGGIVAMTLLYPLENIRTRLQVQVKRKASMRHLSPALNAANGAATTPLVHTHATPSTTPAPPEECISPETPAPAKHLSSPASSAKVTPTFVPLNTPRRTLPQPEHDPTCLACVAERAPSSATALAASTVAAAATPAASTHGTFVSPSGEIVYDFAGSVDCVRQVIRHEGPSGLYSGLGSALVGVGCSSAAYFYFYYSLKSAALRYTGVVALGPLHNLFVASVSGVLNVLITLPIWLVNTRMTVGAPPGSRPYASMLDAMRRIVSEEGVGGLYRGLGPSLILVSNPAIQFVVYEQCIRILSKHANRIAEKTLQTAAAVAGATAATAATSAAPAAVTAASAVKLSSLHFFLLGAFAKAVATVATYPYQVVKSREQCSRSTVPSSTSDLVKRMWREEGWPAFFNGMGAKMSQTVLNSAFMFAVYERLVTSILKFLRWIRTEYRHVPKP